MDFADMGTGRSERVRGFQRSLLAAGLAGVLLCLEQESWGRVGW